MNDIVLNQLITQISDLYCITLYGTLEGEFYPIIKDLICHDSDLNYNINLYYNDWFFDSSLILSDNFVNSNFLTEYTQGNYFPNKFVNNFKPIVSLHETYYCLSHISYGVSPLEVFFNRQEWFLIDNSYWDLGLPDSIINKNVTYFDSFIYWFTNLYKDLFMAPSQNLLEIYINKYCHFYQKNEKFIPLENYIDQYNLSLNLLKQLDNNNINHLNYIWQIYYLNILYVIDKILIIYYILYPLDDFIVRDSIINIWFSFFFYIFKYFLGNLFFGIIFSLYFTKFIIFICKIIYISLKCEFERFTIRDHNYMWIYFTRRRLKKFKKFLISWKLSYDYSLSWHELSSKFFKFKKYAMRVILDPIELERYLKNLRSLLKVNKLFHILSIKEFLIDRVKFEFKEELWISILVSGYLGRAIGILIWLPFIFCIRLMISICIRYFSILGFLYFYFYTLCYMISWFKWIFDKEFYFELWKCFVKIENLLAIYFFQDTHVWLLRGLTIFKIKEFNLFDVSTYNSDPILHSDWFNNIFNNLKISNIFSLIKFNKFKIKFLNSFFWILINFFVLMPILFILNKVKININLFKINLKFLFLFNYIIFKLRLFFITLFINLERYVININIYHYIYLFLFMLSCYILKVIIILFLLFILLICFFIFLINKLTYFTTNFFFNLPNIIFIIIGGIFYYFFLLIKQILYFLIYFLINIVLRPKLIMFILIIFIFNLNFETLHMMLIYIYIILPLEYIIEILEAIHIYLNAYILNDSYVWLHVFRPSERVLCAYINLEKFFNFYYAQNPIFRDSCILWKSLDVNKFYSLKVLSYLWLNWSEIPFWNWFWSPVTTDFTKKNLFLNYFKVNIWSLIKLYFECLKFDSITLYYKMNCFWWSGWWDLIHWWFFINFLFELLYYHFLFTWCFEMQNIFGIFVIKIYFIYIVPLYYFLKSSFILLFFTYGFFSMEYFNIGLWLLIEIMCQCYIWIYVELLFYFYLLIIQFINLYLYLFLFLYDYLNKLFLFYFYEFIRFYLFLYQEFLIWFNNEFFLGSTNDNYINCVDIDLLYNKYPYKYRIWRLHVLRKKQFMIWINNWIRGYNGGTLGGTHIKYHRTGLRHPYWWYYDCYYDWNIEDRIGRRLFASRAVHYFQIKYFKHNIIWSNYMFFQTKLYMFIQIYFKINLNLYNSYSRVDWFELFNRHSSDISRNRVKNYQWWIKDQTHSFIRSRLADSSAFISPILDISKFCNAFLLKDTNIWLKSSYFDNLVLISLFNWSLRKQYSIYLSFQLIIFFIIFFWIINFFFNFSPAYTYHPQYTWTKFLENSKINKNFWLDEHDNIDALDFYTNKVKNLEQIFNFTIDYSNYNKEKLVKNVSDLDELYHINLSDVLNQFKELQRNLRSFQKFYKDDLLYNPKITKKNIKDHKKQLKIKLNMLFRLKEQIFLSLIEKSYIKTINFRSLLDFEKALFFNYQEFILSNNINDIFIVFNLMNDKLELLMSRGYRRDDNLKQLSYDINEATHYPLDIALNKDHEILLSLTSDIWQFLYKFNQYFNINSPSWVWYKDNATPIIYKNLNGVLDHTYYFVDEPSSIFDDMFFCFWLCPMWTLVLIVKLNYGWDGLFPNTSHKNDLGLLLQVYFMNNRSFLGSFILNTFFLNGTIALTQDIVIAGTLYHEEFSVMYSYFDWGYIDPLTPYKNACLNYNTYVLFDNWPIIVAPFTVDTIRWFEFSNYFLDLFKELFKYIWIIIKNELIVIYDFIFSLSYRSNCSFILFWFKLIKLCIFLFFIFLSWFSKYNWIIKIFNVDLKNSVYNIDITIKLLEYIDKYSFLGMLRWENYFKRK